MRCQIQIGGRVCPPPVQRVHVGATSAITFYERVVRQIEQERNRFCTLARRTKYRSLEVPRIGLRDGARVWWLRNIKGDLKTGRPKYTKWFRPKNSAEETQLTLPVASGCRCPVLDMDHGSSLSSLH